MKGSVVLWEQVEGLPQSVAGALEAADLVSTNELLGLAQWHPAELSEVVRGRHAY